MAVEFEEYTDTRSAASQQPKGSKFAKLVIKMGLATDEKGANIILIVTALICIGLAIALPFVF